jgi:hypothetical protein
MRFSVVASSLVLTALAAVTLIPNRAASQSQQQPQLLPLKPPPPAPIKPYPAVAVTPPQPYGDPSFQDFRKQLLDVTAHKDRAALAKLVVAQGFFWLQDKDLADPHKSGIDNLAKAIDLDAKDGSGWDTLSGDASDPTAAEFPDHKGVICSPADPTLDPKAFQALIEATQTEPPEWGYPLTAGVEVRAAPQPNAPVIDKLGMTLVHVMPDSPQPDVLHVATPSGKAGFIPADAIAPLAGDEICYSKDASGWKITGYLGGVAPQ